MCGVLGGWQVTKRYFLRMWEQIDGKMVETTAKQPWRPSNRTGILPDFCFEVTEANKVAVQTCVVSLFPLAVAGTVDIKT